jgi:putative chitinase
MPGDGPRYRGRGFLQLTGRNNYTALSRAINVDLVNHPELLQNPDLAMSGSIWWWINRLPNNGMNMLADAWNIQQITRMINGGYNDLQARINYSTKALQILQT